MKRLISGFSAGLATILTAIWAIGADFTANNTTNSCVTGTGGLQQCLDIAGENGAADTIFVTPGSYTNNPYLYPSDGTHDSQSLTIMNQQAVLPVIDSGGAGNGMEIDLDNSPDAGVTFLLQGIIFQNGNVAGSDGGGMEMDANDAEITIDNCDFLMNQASSGGGGLDLLVTGDGNVTVTNSTFQGNDCFNGDGGGAQIQTTFGGILFQGNLLEMNDAVSDGDANGGGAAFSGLGGTIVIQGNTFNTNTAADEGGGFWADTNDGDADLIINSNLVTGNTSGLNGGGIEADVFEGTLTITNNIVAGNTSQFDDGGGIDPDIDSVDATMFIVNNTVFGNMAPQGNGGGIAISLDNQTNTAEVYNNIVFGNSAGGNGADIFSIEDEEDSGTGGTVNLFNNDFTDYFSECRDDPGAGCTATINEDPVTNIDEDPDFVNSGTGDFHLLATSPCIDTGDLTPPGGLPNPDFDGITRPNGPLPDMGALEFQIIPTPSPTPTPTATPLPPPPPPATGLRIFGSGILSCSLGNSAAAGGMLWFLFLAPTLLITRRFFN